MKKLLLIIVLFLTGCVSATKTYTPEGKMGFSISCNGTANNMGDCEQKAGEICGARGYTTYSQTGDSALILTPRFGGSKISRSMLIACK